MWTSDTVKIRFVEAAGTERFMPALRKPTANGCWPEYIYDFEDRSGWDQQARDDQMEIWQGRGSAKADALTRYQECLSWTIERIADPERRRLVWGFAFCRAYKREFGKWCEKHGRAKSTAYNRLNRIWDKLSSDFNNERLLLLEPAAYWIGHETPEMAHTEIRFSPCVEGAAAIKFTSAFRTEKSRDLIQTPEDADGFAKFLERRNARLRKLNAWRDEKVAS